MVKESDEDCAWVYSFILKGENNFPVRFHADNKPVIGGGFIQRRLKRLRGFPFRVLRGEFLEAFKREAKLRIDGVLKPQRAIVIKCCNAVGWRDVILAAFLGDCLYKFTQG